MDENRKAVEARLAKLEVQVGILMGRAGVDQTNWVTNISGICKDDSDSDRIVRFGKEIRDAELPDDVMPPESVSTKPTPPSLFDEIATFFASVPSPSALLEFSPSQATIERANQLLELNRAEALDEASLRELDQFEMAESFMRLLKARVRAGQPYDPS